MESLVHAFIPGATVTSIEPLPGGLVHDSYRVRTLDGCFLLQGVNHNVFRTPLHLARNFHRIRSHLQANAYPFALPTAIDTADGTSLLSREGQYWRMMQFIPNTNTLFTPPTKAHLIAAASAYGTFLTHLGTLDHRELEPTIPHFHDLDDRMRTLAQTANKADVERCDTARQTLDQVQQMYSQLDTRINDLPLRVTHNDCKLSNVLFTEGTAQVCAVIDWDTVMAGHVVSDFGDMVRSLCCTVGEEERHLDRVGFDSTAYRELHDAFLESTSAWLTDSERHRLINGVFNIVLEQAVRFLSDYLAGDVYYGAEYPDHNLVKCNNQLRLLEGIVDAQSELTLG